MITVEEMTETEVTRVDRKVTGGHEMQHKIQILTEIETEGLGNKVMVMAAEMVRGYEDRGSRGGGFDDRRGGFDNYDRGSRDDYNRDRGFNDRGYRDRGYDDRGPQRNRDRYEDRGPSRGFDSYDRNRGYDDRGSRGGYDNYDRGPRRDYGGGDRYGDRRRDRYDDDRGDRRGFGSGFRRDEQQYGDRDNRSERQGSRESSREAPKERPRLNLQPRSKPIETDASNAPEKSSIFGSAKPVDTAAKEREIEERLQRKREEERRHLEEEKENRNLYSNSQSQENRPRRDSDRSQDGSSSTSRQRRLSSGSSGKGTRSGPPPITSPNRTRRESEVSNHSEVFSGNDETTEEPKSPVSPSSNKDEPPAKLVPAPPPSVNVWEKRKSEIKSATPTSPPPQQSSSPSSSVSPSQSSQNQPSKSTSSPQNSQTSPPSGNAWGKDRKKDTKSGEAPKENPWFKNQPEGQAKPGGRGRFPGDKCESSDRGMGRGGVRGGRGGRDQKPRQQREKQIPKSIEDMPKFENTSKKDWTDSNKFAGLLDDDDNVEEK
ncbi:hypothetical protein KUTeg_015547 [Tegillarca granosa]|uniref:Eukaryotic translation initiation factor 4B n=1 Tax=Tegillarca granosa TaxID=220873 RepID=A0ABQ9EQH1_TEGGR|nr:hypothetical protein KUTeg_015547 [Tegillarca granosa]